MKTSDYVIDQINNLVEKFSNIKCRYEIDASDNSHVIEIIPSYFLKNNTEIQVYLIEIYNDFIIKFPNEGIFFINNEICSSLINYQYEK